MLADFAEITKTDEPLAPLTWLKVGGAAQYVVEPRNADELLAVVNACREEGLPVRLLGGGSNLLVRQEGVAGVVVRLTNPTFGEIAVEEDVIRCGGGARLSEFVSQAARSGLAGPEILAGIPGTVGGALHGNAGNRAGDVGQFVKSVTVMTVGGEQYTRQREDLSFGYRESSVDEFAVLSAEFALQPGHPEDITRRLRELWIVKKSTQPLSFQSAGCIFKNPRGIAAGALIEKAGLKGTRVGGAEISDRHANFVVTHEGAKSDDVLQLIDLARTKVSESFGVDLELEIQIW